MPRTNRLRLNLRYYAAGLIFTQTGMIPTFGGHDGIIPINIHTTSAILLGFPSMLVLWKAVQDDGKVNWVETMSMIAIFMIVIHLLVAHG